MLHIPSVSCPAALFWCCSSCFSPSVTLWYFLDFLLRPVDGHEHTPGIMVVCLSVPMCRHPPLSLPGKSHTRSILPSSHVSVCLWACWTVVNIDFHSSLPCLSSVCVFVCVWAHLFHSFCLRFDTRGMHSHTCRKRKERNNKDWEWGRDWHFDLSSSIWFSLRIYLS